MPRATLNRICRLLFTSPFDPPLDRKAFIKEALLVLFVRGVLVVAVIAIVNRFLLTPAELFAKNPDGSATVGSAFAVAVHCALFLFFLIPYFFVMYRRVCWLNNYNPKQFVLIGVAVITVLDFLYPLFVTGAAIWDNWGIYPIMYAVVYFSKEKQIATQD